VNRHARNPVFLDMRRFALVVIGVALALAGCGGSATPANSPQGEHNQADLFFAQRMILNEAQAVDAAKVVEGRTANSAVRALASEMATTTPQLADWVNKWGAIPGVGSASVPGAVDAEDLAQLLDLTSTRFDSRWLDLMIVHHRGVITVAETELNQGGSAEVRDFARKVAGTTQSRLDRMQGMTGG
jgi:uncharacterized protein (DUF305 family)